MTLMEMILWWETINNKSWETDFWNKIDMTEFVKHDELLNAILYEFSDMEVLQTDTRHFEKAVTYFFKHWRPYILELGKTLTYEYDPLKDYHMTHHKDTDDHETIDRTIDTNYTEHSVDITAVSAFNDVAENGEEDGFHNRNKMTHDGNGETHTEDDTERQENIGEDYTEEGNRNYAFTELIAKQREIVQFDVLRWIMNKWAGEIMVAVW